MKYWEIKDKILSAAGWSWGYCSSITPDGWRWIADVHRKGKRHVVHSDELLSAFLHLEAQFSGLRESGSTQPRNRRKLFVKKRTFP